MIQPPSAVTIPAFAAAAGNVLFQIGVPPASVFVATAVVSSADPGGFQSHPMTM